MKTAMIWGATGSIGSAVVKKLLDQDWNISAIVRDPDRISFDIPHRFSADITDLKQIKAIIEPLSKVSKSYDLMVYAIGDITAEKITEQSPETWDRIININLTGAYLATHYSLPLLSKEAHLVYLGAITENLVRAPRLAAYTAAKGGLESFTKILGREERKRRITLVRPSAVKTSFWEKVPFSAPPSALTVEQVADEIVNAYETGHKGVLDL